MNAMLSEAEGSGHHDLDGAHPTSHTLRTEDEFSSRGLRLEVLGRFVKSAARHRRHNDKP